MKNRNIYAVLLLILVFITVAFIFSNSLSNVADSKTESQRVLELIRPILAAIVGEENVTIRLVRKLAHFVEFGLLGLVLAFLFLKVSFAPLFLMLMVALSDETIQIFTGRGDQVQDIWLDFLGACCGFFFGVLVRSMIRRFSRKTNAG